MNEQTMKAERKRGQRDDESFKRQAVELWLRSGKNAEGVAGELGIRKGNLYEAGIMTGRDGIKSLGNARGRMLNG